jgi:ubiquinone/menaquinone biosynthesis C-methylase UbiE
VLGYTENELQRLMRQSAVYAELTENLLRSAGISAGMRVLDVGCGSGCVSLLAARLVGPSGAVVGVDKSPQALAFARQRAEAGKLRQVTFIEGDVADLDCKQSFDALIGRFVLMFLPDPAAVLRTLARHVRKGGVIVFQEMDISSSKAIPCMPLRKRCTDWIVETFRRAEVDIEMGPKLYATFLHAGLPAPQMNLQARIGGEPDLLAHEYLSDLVASLLPMMTRLGVATAAAVGVETLAARLREETLSSDVVTILPSLIGAWARLPA